MNTSISDQPKLYSHTHLSCNRCKTQKNISLECITKLVCDHCGCYIFNKINPPMSTTETYILRLKAI